jgi:NADPH2:quinone reductase
LRVNLIRKISTIKERRGTMKAIHVHEFGPPEIMLLEELPDPKPGPGQVVVKIHAIGVNPVDIYMRSGGFSFGPELPYTPGMDGAGVVESIGEGVKRVTVGERVYVGRTLSGSYAEKALCRETQVQRLPDRISFKQGAGVGVPYAAAYHALFNRAQAKNGETILVHGADGGVGIAAVQLAHSAGMRIIGTCGSERGDHLVKEHGAYYVFNHHSPGHFKEILDATEGHGVDVILEMLANVNLGKDLPILAQNGRVVVIGSRGNVEINPRDIMRRNASILGMVLLKLSDDDLVNIHAELTAGLEKETLTPVIGREFPLSEAPRAHHEIMETPSYGKIILLP